MVNVHPRQPSKNKPAALNLQASTIFILTNLMMAKWIQDTHTNVHFSVEGLQFTKI
jgi:hypothetical protein